MADIYMTHTHPRQDTHPLNIFYGIRWTEASDNPLSHIYGRKGEKFVLIEPIGQHGTGTSRKTHTGGSKGNRDCLSSHP